MPCADDHECDYLEGMSSLTSQELETDRAALFWWDSQNVRASDDINSRNDWAEGQAWETSILADSKIVFAFIKAKANMKLPDMLMLESCVQKTELIVDEKSVGTVKGEISAAMKARGWFAHGPASGELGTHA
jgi:hypothetical protein